MSAEKHRLLVDHLIQKTASEDISWQESPREDAFQVSFPQYTLLLYPQFNPDEFLNDYHIEIINNNGRVVDGFSDAMIAENGPMWYKKMEALYESARRKALGADKALDDILSSLEGKGDLF